VTAVGVILVEAAAKYSYLVTITVINVVIITVITTTTVPTTKRGRAYNGVV